MKLGVCIATLVVEMPRSRVPAFALLVQMEHTVLFEGALDQTMCIRVSTVVTYTLYVLFLSIADAYNCCQCYQRIFREMLQPQELLQQPESIL